MTKPFAPSSWMLDQMIANAMAKCDADIEQTKLKKEAELYRRAEKLWTAQAKAKSQQFWSRT